MAIQLMQTKREYSYDMKDLIKKVINIKLFL